ncbi:predicted protein [Nematostella vectensis]|uniref:DNA/RNA non-specific endonuclease domain-containing protein n=1 Tax=Nematostella vectensis TaxID=45351 RepID=A7T912_NEMVE|nr:predicted protein [Nematostella vectensis]|eukprot:XP_001619621.1 hypothetical protein NEMVEDRAFT_v1g224007 [Nematostella vectensis]
MVPNADHDYDEYRPTMNTFLLSNIAPQYHKFNIRDWLNLEIYVRDLASGSTIYVISGSIFDEDADGNRDHDNNITRWIKDDRPNTVAIPTHFYKIITRCNVNKTSLYEVPGCSGRLEVISFILPHRSEYHCQYRTDKEYLLDHSASVRDVERLTGTSFFTDLPPAEQARLKAATPIELWPTKEVKRNMKKEEEQRRLAEEGGARPKRLNLRGVVKGFKNIKRGKDKKTEGGDQDKKKDKDKKKKSDKEKKKKT